jgi:FtsP/CotA-like multicopper oxidase with cupredoxin domain
VEKKYIYQNDQGAGNLWYHDHALGITRLNVYAGLAGFYFVRDNVDTGLPDNPLGLPAWPYEKAYAIQDRMFRSTGELFYPGFPGDPFWSDFITDQGLADGDVPQPSALAEFFGDHMVVNGLIWPREDVEPRKYRLHLLNGMDSRFMVIQFRAVPAGETDLTNAGATIPFWVIGSDQGLASSATQTHILLSEPGSRYDIVFDFSDPDLAGERIIMENIGGDAPFGGDYGLALDPDEDFFPDRQTDRIMAFDVVLPVNGAVADTFNPAAINGSYGGNAAAVTRTRKVALFEGTDEYGRLQPLLGTAEPATDYLGNSINWPNTPEYVNAGLVGPMEGSIAWHSPTTENPALGSTEIWEIYNATGDAHPVHLHLVNFEILDRQEFIATVVDQPVVQHNGVLGNGFRLEGIQLGNAVAQPTGYVESAPKDMVTALPGQVTRIKATFDKPGRYVWHCHILSHEDHEMMRVLHVGPGA